MNTDMNNNDELLMQENAAVLNQFINGTYQEQLGIRFTKQMEGYCQVEMEVRPDHLNVLGGIHGGLLYSLADIVAGYCIHKRGESNVATTASGTVNFLNAAVNLKKIYAEGRVVKKGKRLAYTEATVYGEDGTIFAQGIFTYARISLAHVEPPKYEN